MRNYKTITEEIQAAQSAYHESQTAEGHEKVKALQKELMEWFTKGAKEHEEIVPGTLVGSRRYVRGGFFEVGAVGKDGKNLKATGETREEAVENWNNKKFV